MGATLDRLKSEGKIKCLIDYRQSLEKEQITSTAVSSYTQPISYVNAEMGRALRSNEGAYASYANGVYSDLTSGGCVLVFLDNFDINSKGAGQLSCFTAARNGGVLDWQFLFTHNNLIQFSNGVTSSSGTAADVPTYMFGARNNGSGSNTDFYQNGAKLSGSAVVSVTTNAQLLTVGNINSVPQFRNCPVPIYQVVITDNTVTEQEISAIYSEFLSEQGATLEEYELKGCPDTPDTDAVLHLDFQSIDGAGNLLDLSQNGNTGVVSGGLRLNQPSIFGKSIGFVADDLKGVTVADTDDLSFTDNIFTISFWVNFNDLSAANLGILQKATPGANYEYSIYGTGGSSIAFVAFSLGGSGVYNHTSISTSNFQVGRWSHVVFDADGANSRVIIDGVTVSTVAKSANDMANGTAPLLIGRGQIGATVYSMDGSLASLKIYSDLRGDDWVAEEYSRGAQVLLDNYDLKNVPPTTFTVPNGSPIPFTNYKVAAQNATVVENSDGNKFINGTNIISIITRPQEQAYGTWVYEAGNFGVFSLRIGFIANSELTSSASGQYGYYVVLRNSQAVQLIRSVSGGSESILLSSATSYYDFNTYYKLAVTRSTSGVFNLYIKGGAYTDWQLVDVTGGSGTNPVTDNTYKSADVNFESVDAESGGRFRHLGTHFGALTLDEIKSFYK